MHTLSPSLRSAASHLLSRIGWLPQRGRKDADTLLDLRMAVEPKGVSEDSGPFLGYGSLILALVVLHLAVFLFWLWQVTGATARRPKVAQD